MIKYSKDDRYVGEKDEIRTNNGVTFKPVIRCDTLESIYSKISDYSVIGIDELQFFPDAIPFVTTLLKQGKRIYVSSLDADSEGEPFGDVSKLLHLSDKFEKLRAICMKDGCSKKAIYSFCKKKKKGKIYVGGSESYSSLCRSCFKEAKQKAE